MVQESTEIPDLSRPVLVTRAVVVTGNTSRETCTEFLAHSYLWVIF